MPGAPSSPATQRPEIVGQRNHPRGFGCRPRLDQRVFEERLAGLLRFGQAERARADDLDPVGFDQIAKFRQLAHVMRRRDDPAGEAAMG